MKKLILENTFSWNYKLKHLNEATRGEMLNKLRTKGAEQAQAAAKANLELQGDDMDPMDHLKYVISQDRDDINSYYKKLYDEMRGKLKEYFINNYIIAKGENPNDPKSIEWVDEQIDDIIEHPEDWGSVDTKLQFWGPEGELDDEEDIDWSEEAVDKYLADDSDDLKMSVKDFSTIARWQKDKRPIGEYDPETGQVTKGKGLPSF